MRLKRQTSNCVAHLLDRRCNDTLMPSNTGPTAHNSCAGATVACKILKRSLLVEPLLTMKRSQPRGPAHMIVVSKDVCIPVIGPSYPHLAPPSRLGADICCKSISSTAKILKWFTRVAANSQKHGSHFRLNAVKFNSYCRLRWPP